MILFTSQSSAQPVIWSGCVHRSHADRCPIKLWLILIHFNQILTKFDQIWIIYVKNHSIHVKKIKERHFLEIKKSPTSKITQDSGGGVLGYWGDYWGMGGGNKFTLNTWQIFGSQYFGALHSAPKLGCILQILRRQQQRVSGMGSCSVVHGNGNRCSGIQWRWAEML